MDREYKGHGYGTHADDYCVVDLETTGIFVRSAKIIEISAIKVRGNQVIDEYSTLVNPECHIPMLGQTRVEYINYLTFEEWKGL